LTTFENPRPPLPCGLGLPFSTFLFLFFFRVSEIRVCVPLLGSLHPLQWPASLTQVLDRVDCSCFPFMLVAHPCVVCFFYSDPTRLLSCNFIVACPSFFLPFTFPFPTSARFAPGPKPPAAFCDTSSSYFLLILT